jgi:hypothetical protein
MKAGSRLEEKVHGFARLHHAEFELLRDTAYTLADQVTPEQWAAKYHDAQVRRLLRLGSYPTRLTVQRCCPQTGCCNPCDQARARERL